MILQFGIPLARPDHGFLLILTGVPPPYECQIEQTDAIAYHDGNLGGHIAGRIFGTEYLRSYVRQLCFHWPPREAIPMIFPTQYDIKYIAATVVFLVYPATFELINDNNATNVVGLACVM